MSSATTPTPPVWQVSPFEANLIHIARFIFGNVPSEEALPLIRGAQSRPPCLSAAAVHLVKDTLGKGCVLQLVRGGGWKSERFLREGQPRIGRLWERTTPESLAFDFTPLSMEFLLWLVTRRVGDGTTWNPKAAASLGDQLLFFFAYESLREETDVAAALRTSPFFAEHGLIRLLNPGDFAGAPLPDNVRYDAWVAGPGAAVLEAMQSVLADRWIEIERGKGQIGDWGRMHAQGQAEFDVLERFFSAVEQAGRLDLARFVLIVLGRVLTGPDMTPAFWTGGLQSGGPARLADRLRTQQQALSLLRQAGRLRQWEGRARRSGYLDDDYASAKFFLSDWEQWHGSRSALLAERIVQMLEPFAPAGTEESSASVPPG